MVTALHRKSTNNILLHVAGELKLHYLAKPYYVTLGLYQMAILLQYNDCDNYTADELKERTKLEEKEWSRHVQPLLDNKIILLVCLYIFCALSDI